MGRLAHSPGRSVLFDAGETGEQPLGLPSVEAVGLRILRLLELLAGAVEVGEPEEQEAEVVADDRRIGVVAGERAEAREGVARASSLSKRPTAAATFASRSSGSSLSARS